MRINKGTKGLLLLVAVLLTLFFTLLYLADNKYKTPPPYGRGGVIVLEKKDFSGDRPLMLTSGWLFTDDRATDRPTYIGEFSNLQRGDPKVSPHGRATYSMTLRYSGEPVEVAVSFPQLFSWHVISLDDRVLSRGVGGAKISFTLTEGDHLLSVHTVSKQGYYSGMYHPPMLGTTKAVFNAVLVQCVAYGLAFFATLALALFTLTLWGNAGDRMAFWFGMLCYAFALYLSYYFVRLLNMPFVNYFYLMQSVSLYWLCFCVLRLTSIAGQTDKDEPAKFAQWALAVFSGVLLLLAILIPVFTWAVWIHGMLTDVYYISVFCALLFLVLRKKPQTGWEHNFAILGCTVFGAGLLLNLFASNLFEPILTFWQFEWCGIFLVVLFAAMMATRNKRILAQNEAFSNHLEELVEVRTEELTRLLEERKAFFADMAHDLKAPIFAARSFIQAIRSNNTGVDGDLLHYIDLVEQKQQEMSQRVQSLISYNKLESIDEPCANVSVRSLLKESYDAHHMAAEVESVHLMMIYPEQDGEVYAQPKKLSIMLENLIFNALHATPAGGSITLSAETDEDECHLTVADTGNGIPLEDLPRIFQRFYVGKENKGTGSGLGLYLVKSIVDELSGEISVSSKPGQGAVFYIDLPLKK